MVDSGPGLVLWLLRHGVDVDAVERGLDREGGVRGLAGDADMRAVLARDDDEASLAVDVYVHRLRASIGAMAATLDGLDALVFTGGVGEHAPAIRERTVAGLGFLGVALDVDANATATGDADFGAARTLVVTAREDLEVARHVRALLA